MKESGKRQASRVVKQLHRVGLARPLLAVVICS